MLEFRDDAICLSGLSGTRLKCAVVEAYYPFWWGITSGGPARNHRNPTAIVELNAGTGEVYVADSNETVLGSAGHALDLKINNTNTETLKVILVEENAECYLHLKQVISRRWPAIPLSEAEGPVTSNPSNVYLLSTNLDRAIEMIDGIDGRSNLGNALFYFDPLRSVKYSTIDNVATTRIPHFFMTGTEFIIFVFTSDWFLGRDNFAPLPTELVDANWTPQQWNTVLEADELFGDQSWRQQVLTADTIDEKMESLIRLYQSKLHKWFRYVLPLPFNPRDNQLFHLILCSNFNTGVRMTRETYVALTGNPKYAPDNVSTYAKFKTLHPQLFVGLDGRRKPTTWKMLWQVIRYPDDVLYDYQCKVFTRIEQDAPTRMTALQWLEREGYLHDTGFGNAWNAMVKRYRINWDTIVERLEIETQRRLEPVSLEQIQRGLTNLRSDE